VKPLKKLTDRYRFRIRENKRSLSQKECPLTSINVIKGKRSQMYNRNESPLYTAGIQETRTLAPNSHSKTKD